MIKAVFKIPSSLADWSGQIFYRWFPQGVVLKSTQKDNQVLITGWLVRDSNHLKNSLKIAVNSSGGKNLRFYQAKQQNWIEKFKSKFPVQKIGKFTLVPAWHKNIEKYKGKIIRLNPGQAFGTGLHESTRLMLRYLEKLGDLKGKHVLDIGAGSGILGLAALNLNALKVTSVEAEAAACVQMRENLILNKVESSSFKVIRGNFPLKKIKIEAADVILANIITPVLLQLLPEFRRFLKKEGALAMSGIYKNKEAWILKKKLKEFGFNKITHSVKGLWHCLCSRK
jgi:ribosomal protein L11 methyltransferase